MRAVMKAGIVLGLVAAGYYLGTVRAFRPHEAKAQVVAGELATEDKVKLAQKAVDTAQQSLISEGKYQPVVNGINSFATTVGGVDALKDLQEGRGVDPETFAALYAGQVMSKYRDDLTRNEKDQLVFRGKVVRMYSIDRLKKLYARRAEIAERRVKVQ